MKILHVTPFYEPAWAYGGMARASSGLCRALARRGHDVTVATTRLDPAHAGHEELGGVHVRRFDSPGLLTRRLVPWSPALRGFLTGALASTDVVHVHGHRNGLAVTAVRRLRAAGRPWVLSTHGTYPAHGQLVAAKAVLDRTVFAPVVAGAQAVVAVSAAEARDLPCAARVIPNGVEPVGAARRTRTGGRPRVLFVGNDRPQKRARVLPALLAALPDVELHLVGPYGAELRRSLTSDRVGFTGVLAGDALAVAYADADVLVHPAAGEAFGLVPFEAALAGTAAVVAGGHGSGEWFARAGGCVVAPDDETSMHDAVRRRLENRALAAREAAAVADFTRHQLTWDRAAESMEVLYRDVARTR